MSMKSENRISARDDSLDLPSLRLLNLVKLPLDENRDQEKPGSASTVDTGASESQACHPQARLTFTQTSRSRPPLTRQVAGAPTAICETKQYRTRLPGERQLPARAAKRRDGCGRNGRTMPQSQTSLSWKLATVCGDERGEWGVVCGPERGRRGEAGCSLRPTVWPSRSRSPSRYLTPETHDTFADPDEHYVEEGAGADGTDDESESAALRPSQTVPTPNFRPASIAGPLRTGSYPGKAQTPLSASTSNPPSSIGKRAPPPPPSRRLTTTSARPLPPSATNDADDQPEAFGSVSELKKRLGMFK
ncbi:hypothetical protein PCANC_19265 [Puccinia coronata f. sp. avenae]|uniref:Uncharacterized protein n=1 Tax=Puccinia coronata f. sp. avenae TaxID=200324 RepID=A0A2N5UFL1_9BASI|nr:hypothetical protein PCANC_19265 [Puccinia coronata f. sp. avenae]